MAELSKVLNLDSSLISKIFKIESSNVSKICGLDWPTGAGGGDRGIFGGGAEDINSKNVIEYVTITSLGNVSDFGDLPGTRTWLSATSNGASDRGVFGGGNTYGNVIEYVTISSIGNGSDFGDLTVGRYGIAACSNNTNDRGMFGGGNAASSGDEDMIDYITISSTGNAVTFGDLVTRKYYHGSCSNGTNNRGIWAGGRLSYHNDIDYVTISSLGNASDFGDLTSARTNLAGTSNLTNNRGVFAGGNVGDPSSNVIDYITITSLGNTSDFGDLFIGSYDKAATSNGTNERGLIAGGQNWVSWQVKQIDYIKISSLGNGSDFGDLSAPRMKMGATSNA